MSKKRISIHNYLTSEKPVSVYRLKATPNFSPIDLNVQFIMEEGWSNADRLRFHTESKIKETKNQPIDTLLSSVKPHILLRHYDRAEDSFVSIHVGLNGIILAFSNDQDFAHKYLQGLFLEFPPSFHSLEDLDISEGWVEDSQTCAFFLGLLQGALGWDSFNQIPSAIRASLEEAEKALSIANYRSCVVMCRRTIEALLKFAFQRLLNRAPLDNQGRELKLNTMIREFKQQQPPPIPLHLLHILDSIELLEMSRVPMLSKLKIISFLSLMRNSPLFVHNISLTDIFLRLTKKYQNIIH